MPKLTFYLQKSNLAVKKVVALFKIVIVKRCRIQGDGGLMEKNNGSLHQFVLPCP